MNYVKKTMIALFLLTIIIILCSCGASHKLHNKTLFKDVEFKYTHLIGDGLIIAGFSSEQIELSKKKRIKYGTLLSDIMQEKMKHAAKINFVNTLQFTNKIGKDNYFEIMYHFDLEKSINKDIVLLIKDSIPEYSYLLFAYIDEENIIDESVEDIIENEEGKEELETEYTKTYILDVEFQLFDLHAEKLVLNTNVFNEAKRTDTRTTRTGFLDSIWDSLISSIFFGEPAEINREEVLAKIAEKFAKDLGKIKN